MDTLGQIFLSTIERLSSFGVLLLYRWVHWKLSFIQRCPLFRGSCTMSCMCDDVCVVYVYM